MNSTQKPSLIEEYKKRATGSPSKTENCAATRSIAISFQAALGRHTIELTVFAFNQGSMGN